MTAIRVLIVGAGIGGLALARALRAHGVTDVRVIEQAPAIKPLGTGIWVPPNAMQVLDRLGLAEATMQRGVALDGIELMRPNRRKIFEVPMAPMRERYGQTTVSIRRAALLSLLEQGLPAGTIMLGQRVVEVHPGTGEKQHLPSLCTVDETGGRKVYTAEVIVGADGAHSVVRDVLQPGVKLRGTGQTCFRGLARYDLEQASICREIWGGIQRFGYSAVGPGEVYFFATLLERHRPRGELAAEELVAELRRRFADFPSDVRGTLDGAVASSIVETPLADLPPRRLRRWQSGGVVLLGDAAHATTPNLGQGGAQAIEDAEALAAQLAKTPGEPAVALARYELVRRRKAYFVTRMSRRIGRLAHLRPGVLQLACDLALRLGSPLGQRSLHQLYTVET